MPLVFAGICSHAPGIVNRAERVEPARREAFYGAYRRMGDAIRDAKADALIVIGAEHFANFFMNNMPAFAMGMADYYEGPIEDEAWMRIKRRKVPGNRDLSERLIARVMDDGRCRLFRGMEVRPRHHGAAAFPDARNTISPSSRPTSIARARR